MFETVTIPDLPSPSLVEVVLFESIWMGPFVALLLAGVAVAICRARGQARVAIISIAVGLALAGGSVALSTAVTTDREALRSATRAIVSAVATGDTEALEPLVHDEVWLRDIPTAPEQMGRDALLVLVERMTSTIAAVEEHRVREVQAVTDGPSVGRTHVLVWVRTATGGFPVNSAWRLDWQRLGPDAPWRLAGVEFLGVDGIAR